MTDGFVCYMEDLPISESLTDCDLNYSDNTNTMKYVVRFLILQLS